MNPTREMLNEAVAKALGWERKEYGWWHPRCPIASDYSLPDFSLPERLSDCVEAAKILGNYNIDYEPNANDGRPIYEIRWNWTIKEQSFEDYVEHESLNEALAFAIWKKETQA